MRELFSYAEWQQLLKHSKENLNGVAKTLVVDFYATWCGPCRMASPHFEALSRELEETSNVLFLKVDSDKLKDLSATEGIRSLPTFKIYTRGLCVETITGFNLPRLRQSILNHCEAKLLESVKIFANETDSQEQFNETKKVLLRLANNILDHPLQQNYRSVRIDNKLVMETLLPVPGAMQCLFDMGFEEDTDRFTLPANADLSKLMTIRNQLNTITYKLNQISLNTNVPSSSSSSKPSVVKASAKKSAVKASRISRQYNILEGEHFLEKLKVLDMKMNRYESAASKAAACETMKLHERKAKCLLSSGENNEVDQSFLLQELLRWFKEEFFSWMDRPNCSLCQSNENVKHTHTESATQLTEGDASQIEVYRCTVHPSQGTISFPRYNCPRKLLQTRTGRCGEWANCFCLCLVAAGFSRVRFVLDATDHVWCEVFLKLPGETQERWVHCDPCECVTDRPLLYESGWGKKLTYCVAHEVGTHLIQDVTWRYIAAKSFDEVLERRTILDEKKLTKFIRQHNIDCFNKLPPSQQSTLKLIHAKELVEFLTPPSLTQRYAQGGLHSDEARGRTTGSLDWRLQRGELGNEEHQPANPKGLFLTPAEINALEVHLRYSCAKDCYVRGSNANSGIVTNSWNSLVSRFENIGRKVEHDWEMVYLSRMENSPANRMGFIEWELDLTKQSPVTSLVIREVKILFTWNVFESGECSASLCCYKKDDKDEAEPSMLSCFPVRGFMTFSESDLQADQHNIVKIVLRAELKNSTGSCAWQHAQLFRQKKQDSINHPLDWIISFKQSRNTTNE